MIGVPAMWREKQSRNRLTHAMRHRVGERPVTLGRLSPTACRGCGRSIDQPPSLPSRWGRVVLAVSAAVDGPACAGPTTACRNPSDFAGRLPPVKLRSPHLHTVSWRHTILFTNPLQEMKLRVLVVDDNVDAADMLAALLGICDCTVNVAYSGLEALTLGDVIRPEVVLLDVAMPAMNGCETARQIRERPWGRQACIVALTARGDGPTRRRTQQAGMDFHLTKPVGLELLLGILATVRP